MKLIIPALLLITAAAPLALTGCGKTSVASESPAAASPADAEAAFIATYKKALEANDTATLDGFLVTEGSPAEVVEFFKMMRDVPREGTLTVTLETPTPEEATKFNQPMEMPDGLYYKLPLTPTHKLVVSTATKNSEGTSSSSSSLPVVAKNGKFLIPLPVPTGQAAK